MVYGCRCCVLFLACTTNNYMTDECMTKTSGNHSGVFRDRTSLNAPKWLLAAEYGYVIKGADSTIDVKSPQVVVEKSITRERANHQVQVELGDGLFRFPIQPAGI